MSPEIAKPLPATVTELTVSAAVPEDVNVSVLVEVVFTVTLPKLREVALSVMSGVAAVVPVPLSETVVVPPVGELLEMEIAPLAAPVTVGSKLTCKVTD